MKNPLCNRAAMKSWSEIRKDATKFEHRFACFCSQDAIGRSPGGARRRCRWPFAVGYAAPPGGARLGGYSLDYRICADFELELRYLYLAKLKAVYLPECVVVMRMGGASTAGWRSNVEINREDLRALRSHGIWSCLPLIYLKYLFKIWGFVFKRK